MIDSFYFTDPGDPDNEIAVTLTEDGIVISVAAEKAVDSYNELFECGIVLPHHEAKRLRDYLNKVLK